MNNHTLKCFWQTITDNRKSIIRYALPGITFVIGFCIPSPFIKNNKAIIGDAEQLNLIDTVKMVLPDGSTYDGSIIASNKKRHGFGSLTTVDGSVYEGNWDNDILPFGRRTTLSSVYNGKFDPDLNNEGFGIVRYTKSYIEGKKKQGFADCDIIAEYIGNWHLNNKSGLGRSVKVDGSMDFGMYIKGYSKKLMVQIIVLEAIFMV